MAATVENRRAPAGAHRAPLPRVRVADVRDLDAMVDLLTHLFEGEADFTPAPARQRRALRMLMARPARGRLFVAVRGDDVLGMVSLLVTISTAEGGEVAWLEDLVVRPDCQGQGIGTCLLRAAVTWAEKTGLHRVSLLTDRTNRGAHRLYRRHAFTASTMIPFRRHLGDRQSLPTGRSSHV